MRSKTPLTLMEQAVMVLVFALAAALCLRVFVFSDSVSKQTEARDRAVVQAQMAAECLKHAGGQPEAAMAYAAGMLGGAYDQDTNALTVWYDEDWTASGTGTAGAPVYQLTARETTPDVPGLVQMQVEVKDGEKVLFSLEVAWQDVPDVRHVKEVA